MAVEFPTPPESYEKVVKEGLSKMSGLYQNRTSVHPMGAAFRGEEAYRPVQIFTVEGRQAQDGKKALIPVPEGWRYFVGQSEPLRTADVVLSPTNKQIEFLGLSVGPQVEMLKDLLASMETDAGLAGRHFECRLLRALILNLTAIWLSALDGLGDIIIPLVPVWPPLSAGKRYEGTDFYALLAEAFRAKPANSKILFSVKR